jgi:hypothetical protein
LQRRAERIALDRARRGERSSKAATLVLTTDIVLRYDVAVGGFIHMRGRDESGRPTSAIWYAPDDFDRVRVLEIRNWLGTGVAVRLDGYWRCRTVNGTKLLEFIAQYIAIGDEPRIPSSRRRSRACLGVDIPSRCFMKNARQKADAGSLWTKSIATSFPHDRRSAC